MAPAFKIYQFTCKMKKYQNDPWYNYCYNDTNHIHHQPHVSWVIVKAFICEGFKKDDPDPETKNDADKYRNEIFWL